MYGRGARGVANLFRYCLCWVLLVSPLAFSADRVVVVEPSQLQRTYTPGSGPYAFNDSRSWSEPVSVQNGRVNVPVVSDKKYTWANFRTGLKNAIKINPSSLLLNGAIAGAVGAVGWVMDPENNTIHKPGDGTAPTPTATSYWWSRHGYGGRYSSVREGCEWLRDNGFGPGWTITSVSFSADGLTGYCTISGQFQNHSAYSRFGDDCPAGSTYDNVKGACMIPGAPIPLIDADIDAFTNGITDPGTAASYAPSILDSVPGSFDYPDGYDFSGPESIAGSPVTTTSTSGNPASTTVTEVTPSYNFDYSSNPNTITTTTTTTTNVYQDGNLTLTQNTTNAGVINPVQPAPTELEIPTDCEFMPTVCAWLDWFKTPAPMPEPDMPQVVDDDFRQEYTVSFGGSCPAPRTVDTQFGTLSLSWQPLCDLASIIRYLVIASASLYAAFIGLGISRGSN